MRRVPSPFEHSASRLHRDEGGQIVILFVVVIVFFALAGAMVIDLGVSWSVRRQVQNGVDITALAGIQELPTNPTLARTVAEDFAVRNGLTTPPYNVQISIDNTCWNTDPLDDPTEMDSMVVRVTRTKGPQFGDFFGIGNNSLGARAKACWGGTGIPLDVVIVIDRSSSMSTDDLNNAKTAAKAVLQIYDPNIQYIGLGVLGPSRTTPPSSNACSSPNNPGLGLASSSAGSGTWMPVSLSSNYLLADGSLNTSSLLVKTINCLNHSSVGTNLATPMDRARQHLVSNGRPGVKKGIIFMTDGAANESGSRPCRDANNAATAAKNANIEVFTIGFGIESERCDESGTYDNERVTELLADMATNSLDDQGHCDTPSEVTAENNDGDHFLCAPRTEDLSSVFTKAAKALAATSLVE